MHVPREDIMRLPGFRASAHVLLALALLLALFVSPLRAQTDANYPSKPIRLVVGYAAGGGNDIFARLIGQKMSELLGQPVVVENKPAAGSRVAAEFVANQPGDGYTLLVGATGGMSIAAAVFPKLAYHPTKSFIPLTEIANFPLVLAVPATSPIHSIAELVAWAKAHPDKANYASSSPAFTITTELLKLKTGMPGVPIPYKSTNEMLLSVAAEQSLLSISDPPPAVPLAAAGKVRILAVTGSDRLAEFPDVPSMTESGLPDINVRLWSGVFAPASTPPAIAKKLETTLRAVITSKDVQEKLKGMAVTPSGGSSDDFRKIIEADIRLFTEVAKAANLKFED
jgi:tripartite-type tricarboxylate transporter receptor subunit TctC